MSPSPGMMPTIASRPKRMEVPGTWNRLSRMTAHRRSESSRITRLYFFETPEDTEGTEFTNGGTESTETKRRRQLTKQEGLGLGCRPQVGTVWVRQDGRREHHPSPPVFASVVLTHPRRRAT